MTVAIGGSPAIRVRGLTKRYGDVQAVAGVDFDVAAGEIFGLLGPNGAGKTTTVEILEGLRAPDDGEVTVLGIDVARGADELKPRIGVSLQTAALYPKLTVTEVLDLFRSFYPRARPTARADRGPRPGRAAQRADQCPLRRPAPAAGGRPRTRQRSRARLPRRADDRARSGGAPIAVGPRPGHEGERPDDPADDALHGGGRGPVRSPRDHGPRPDHRDGHGRRARHQAIPRARGAVRSTARAVDGRARGAAGRRLGQGGRPRGAALYPRRRARRSARCWR